MTRTLSRTLLAAAMLACSFLASTSGVRARQDSDDIRLRMRLTPLNESGVTGTAVITVDDDGLAGRLRADNLVPGHAYTVWLFYQEGSAVGGPGRFDSAVAEDDDLTFRGRVRGLQVASGAIVKLVIFDHPDLGPSTVTRADNLLTPNGGHPVAQALFEIP